MILQELLTVLPDARLTGNAHIQIDHIEYDSRQVRPGTLFVAIAGFARDGYDFAGDAMARGAVAVLGTRESYAGIATHVQVLDARRALADLAAYFYAYPGKALKVVGVTGTNGKTTTCHLIRKMLELRGKKAGLVTSTIYDTGGETFHADRTTPESLDLQRLLYLMRKNGCQNAVIEVSSHALSLFRVPHINFRVAVYTNLTRDHLDFHGTMEAYMDAKALLAQLVEGEHSYVVINLDVPPFRRLFGELRSSHMSYSLSDPSADVFAPAYQLQPERSVFDLATPMGKRTVSYQLPGRFNLVNAIGAAAGGLAAGVDVDTVVAGLEAARPIPGRLNTALAGQPFAVYVDYAHTPDAIGRLCQAARELSKGKLLLLFGCGGDRDRGKRPLMGEAATASADYVVVTSDNPRTEDPHAIISEIRTGLRGDQFEIEPDRRTAIRRIIGMAKPGDTVLLAGKGAEDYQEINGVRHPFDDMIEALAALREQGFEPVGAGSR